MYWFTLKLWRCIFQEGDIDWFVPIANTNIHSNKAVTKMTLDNTKGLQTNVHNVKSYDLICTTESSITRTLAHDPIKPFIKTVDRSIYSSRPLTPAYIWPCIHSSTSTVKRHDFWPWDPCVGVTLIFMTFCHALMESWNQDTPLKSFW